METVFLAKSTKSSKVILVIVVETTRGIPTEYANPFVVQVNT